MKITIEPQLSTSVENFFAYPPKVFKNQQYPTQILKIPLQQRDYDWGNEKKINKEGNNIDGLLEDLDYHVNNSVDNYFAGTVLLENQQSYFLKLIDGQQRITTLFLLNYVGYLFSRYRLEYMPTYPNPIQYALEFKDRFDTFLKYEKRVFITNLNDDVNNLINQSGQEDSSEELKKRVGRSRNNEQDYWSNIQIRLQFDDVEINASLVEAVKKSLLLQNNNSFEFKSSKGLYSNGIRIIIEYLQTNNNQGPTETDTYLKDLTRIIDNYLQVCGLAAIISENPDDSFRLFEILNDRGQDLSALDLVKNIILEKCNQNNQSISGFTKDWKKLKENVRGSFSKGKADSIFIENIIRSEGSTLRNREISYLNNKLINKERRSIYSQENISDFFSRLLASSSILKELNENTSINKTNNTSPYNRSQHSCFQNVTFMKMINYNWGPQIILCSNILYLKSSKYTRSLNTNPDPDWKNKSSNSNAFDLNHFTRFLGDITLKLGIIGIVNGLATKDLPSTSKEITQLIINNVENNPNDFNSPGKLIQLKNAIINLLNSGVFSLANLQQFQSRLGTTFEASSGQKKNIVKIILYYIYNQGNQIHNLQFPELEHLEPCNPVDGTEPYYNNMDRPQVINRLGNFALIEKSINITDFSNKPLVEKIKLATTDPELTSIPFFNNDLFLNLNYSNPKSYSSVYGQMPQIKQAINLTPAQDDSFDMNGVPQKYFFEERSKFLASLATKYFCNTMSFIDGSGNY